MNTEISKKQKKLSILGEVMSFISLVSIILSLVLAKQLLATMILLVVSLLLVTVTMIIITCISDENSGERNRIASSVIMISSTLLLAMARIILFWSMIGSM